MVWFRLSFWKRLELNNLHQCPQTKSGCAPKALFLGYFTALYVGSSCGVATPPPPGFPVHRGVDPTLLPPHLVPWRRGSGTLVDVEDIAQANAYSIQEAKLKADEDRRRELAEQKKKSLLPGGSLAAGKQMSGGGLRLGAVDHETLKRRSRVHVVSCF